VNTNGGNGGPAVRRPLARRTVRRLYRQAPRQLRVFLHTKAMGEVVRVFLHTKAPERRMDRRTKGWPRRACTASYGGGRRDRARRHARGAQTIRFSRVPTKVSPKFSTKVHQAINSKVVDVLILYHFHKGRLAFFSIIFAQLV
jgi:hypothetical protein